MSIFTAFTSSMSLPSQLLLIRPPDEVVTRRCDRALETQDPLSAVRAFVLFYGIRQELTGQNGNIMKFVELDRPDGTYNFTSRLYLVGYNGSNNIRIHTLAETVECRLMNRDHVAHVVEFIYEFLHPIGFKGSFKPKPQTDAYLLSSLSTCPTWPQHGYFMESILAVLYDLPLDACTHLLTPFGLQPVIVNKRSIRVVFREVGFNPELEVRKEPAPDPAAVQRGKELAARNDIMAGIYIDLAPKLACCPGAGVLLHAPYSSYEGQLEKDNRRRLSFLALETREVVARESAQGMFFNLADAQDRVCFVQRVLAMRDERRDFKEEGIDRARYHVHYTPANRYEINIYSAMLSKRLHHIRTRKTPLSTVAGVDDAPDWSQPEPNSNPVEFGPRDRSWQLYRRFRKRGQGNLFQALMRRVHRRWKRWQAHEQALAAQQEQPVAQQEEPVAQLEELVIQQEEFVAQQEEPVVQQEELVVQQEGPVA
jgi:hypothetical protein